MDIFLLQSCYMLHVTKNLMKNSLKTANKISMLWTVIAFAFDWYGQCSCSFLERSMLFIRNLSLFKHTWSLLCQAWHLTRWFDTLTHGLYSAVTDFRGMVNWSFFVLLKQLKKIVLICVVCFICEKPSIYFVKASTSKLFPDIHYMLD